MPDLAELREEFSETLAMFWRERRSDYTTSAIPPDDMLVNLLNALASVYEYERAT